MRAFVTGAVLACVMTMGACSKPGPAGGQVAAADTAPHITAVNDIERGRYVALVGGCNDCHTPGYNQSGGATPEPDRMTGNPVGYKGPWGVSYAANLRLIAANTTEDGFVTMMRNTKVLPPMPAQNYSKMHEGDLRALYKYIHSLGPKGEPEPENLPPGVAPKGPVIDEG